MLQSVAECFNVLLINVYMSFVHQCVQKSVECIWIEFCIYVYAKGRLFSCGNSTMFLKLIDLCISH